MKLIQLIFLITETYAIFNHFSEKDDKTIRPKGDMNKCLTIINSKRRIVKFSTCKTPINNKQKWTVTKSLDFGRQYSSVHFNKKPRNGLSQNKEMCLTVYDKQRSLAKVARCRNSLTRGARPIQLFDMLGDEDQLSVPSVNGAKRFCLGVTQDGKIRFGKCDTTSCNTGRNANFKCSSCGWRDGHEDKCDYCANEDHILTNEGNCIAKDSVSKCTERYPASFTVKVLKWYHLQGYNYCTVCDPNDETKCKENSCPQRFNTAVTKNGKCQCPENSSTFTPQSGGPFIGYTACANNLPDNHLAGGDAGRNPDCTNNEYQTAPESKCKTCIWYNQFTCASCKTVNAVISYTNPGSRMYCKCPAGFKYNADKDKCVVEILQKL